MKPIVCFGCSWLFQLIKFIKCLFQENEQLLASLLQAQTNISVLHSELDKLKNIYADQKAQHERWGTVLKSSSAHVWWKHSAIQHPIQCACMFLQRNRWVEDEGYGIPVALQSDSDAPVSLHSRWQSRPVWTLSKSCFCVLTENRGTGVFQARRQVWFLQSVKFFRNIKL